MASTKRIITATAPVSFTWGGKTEILRPGAVVDVGTGATATALIAAIGAGNMRDPAVTGYGGGQREMLGEAFAASNTS
jgi:hypothetical protein